jgi:hypothetical protein
VHISFGDGDGFNLGYCLDDQAVQYEIKGIINLISQHRKELKQPLGNATAENRYFDNNNSRFPDFSSSF